MRRGGVGSVWDGVALARKDRASQLRCLHCRRLRRRNSLTPYDLLLAPCGRIAAPRAMPPPRQLDRYAVMLMAMLCGCWGFNQVAAKLAFADFAPIMRAGLRSARSSSAQSIDNLQKSCRSQFFCEVTIH